MDPRSRDSFTPAILSEALRRYAISTQSLQALDGFESFIYTGTLGAQACILRLSHSLAYSHEMIQGEVDWIAFLADQGIPAARAIPSHAGNLCERIDCKDGYFVAAAFEKACGREPWREDWENGLLRQVGCLVGRMHNLTRHYTPSGPAFRRPDWDFGLETCAEEYLPPGEERVTAIWHALLARLRQLPRERDSFGLIHTDVHGGNFFVDDGRITLFDFGDCLYGWFAYDLAMALFYVLPHRCDTPQQLEFARSAFNELMAGYRQEYRLDPSWLETIPLFLKLREIDLYIHIHRSLDLENLEPWPESYMRGRKERIENELPYVGIDFSQ